MKKINPGWGRLLISVILLLNALSGCSFILPLTEIQPLEEKVVGGSGKGKILLVDISGIISGKKRTGILGVKERPSLVALIKEQLKMAEKDRAIKAVILRINSPGGTVTASDIIRHEIKEFKKKRNVVVVTEMLDIAASGGYYIATASDKIVAHPTTVTGSIGVVAFRFNAEGLMKKIGIKDETIKSGDKKDIGSPLRTMTKEEKKILEGVIKSMYERFIDVVREGRKGIEEERLKEIGDGRIFTARQALDLGLIDEIGYLDNAIEVAKKEAGMKEARVITYARPADYRNNIYSSSQFKLPSTVNLININTNSIMEGFSTRFMYLWLP